MTESMLFDGFPDPDRKTPRTPGEILRARQQSVIDGGHHPISKLPLLPGTGHTCGDCLHRVRNEKHYPKCDQTSMSHCEQSDVRAWFPACIAFAAKDSAQPDHDQQGGRQ